MTTKKPQLKGAASMNDEVREKIIQAALHLASQMPWQYVTLADIAQESELTLAELRLHIDSQFDVLALYGRMLDHKVLKAVHQDPAGTPKEKLFDILMERYEILNQDRAAILSIMDAFKLDPKHALISLPHLGQSMVWMLELAQMETGSWRGALRVAGLAGLYLAVLRVWVRDDSPDLSATMAELDKRLNQLCGMAERLGV